MGYRFTTGSLGSLTVQVPAMSPVMAAISISLEVLRSELDRLSPALRRLRPVSWRQLFPASRGLYESDGCIRQGFSLTVGDVQGNFKILFLIEVTACEAHHFFLLNGNRSNLTYA